MKALQLLMLSAAVMFGTGCNCGTTPAQGGDAGATDSGGPDAGTTDAGSNDAGVSDAGGTDAGVTDAGTSDGGLTDGGLSDGGSDGGSTACTTTAAGPMRGAAIALTSDDSTLLTVNRDVGTVTVMSISYADGEPKMSMVAELAVGGEPWEVVTDACNRKAYVVLRKDQKVVEIDNIESPTPTVGPSVSVGSEPTSIALTPNNSRLFVSNWVDGTLTVIDPISFTVSSTIDLNPTIAATGLLGPNVTPRPALAHPRGMAITNNGDTSDTDETLYVAEWFAVRTAPESAVGTASDTNWKGLLYKVAVGSGAVTTIDLPPVANTGFNDAKGQPTGCFPNQVTSVTIDGKFAYVTSTCASPVGPTGVFQKGACALDSECSGGAAGSCVNGACKGSCVLDSDCGAGSAPGACNTVAGGLCAPLTANAKTTTHPAVTIVDLSLATGTTVTLDTLFAAPTGTGSPSARMPLLPTDVGFRPGFAYVAAQGADGLFRLTMSNGAITSVGSASNAFIDLRPPGVTPAVIHLPIGIAVSGNRAFAFVADDGTRDVTAIDLNTQAIAQGATADLRITSSSALPTGGSLAASVLAGKREFTTGLGRWSLNGAAWGSCAACHVDGLSDNVTWYFARGPRQTISLDGTFSKADTSDQRILNWSGVFDEIADFEANVRGISGGVGALVTTVSSPPKVTDRINLFIEAPQQQGLEGSSQEIANPAGISSHAHTVITDWLDITHYIQNIRSPRAPTILAPGDVAAGQAIFSDPGQGNCIACHSGAKWTYSKVFYPPGDVPNDAFTTGVPAMTSLSGKTWVVPGNPFPAALFPCKTAGQQTMRSGLPPPFEQLQCALRPVGTIVANGANPTGVSPAAVGVLELRQDMVTGAQGAGGVNANDFTFGYNPPSMLGLAVGAPYFHAGNARTLEEAFSSTFVGHYQSAVAQVFNPTATQVRQLTAYLLSIDGSTTTLAIPPRGANGGDICAYP